MTEVQAHLPNFVRVKMDVLRIAVLLGLTASRLAFADSESPAGPVVYTSASGPCFFAVTPKDDGMGIAYKLEADGSFRKLWRIKGWYSSRAYLSIDGRYLVRLDLSPVGHEPSSEHPAVAFYDRGKLLARYSTADLVKDKSKVWATTSHYLWLANQNWFDPARDKKPPEPEPELRDDDRRFALKTADGIIYQFDLTSGKIIRAK